MTILKRKFQRLGVLVRRHPYLVALFGFCAGVASFLLVDRQDDMASLIGMIMLVSWLWLVLEKPIRRLHQYFFGREMPPTLLRFTTQLVHQESYFFVLPFFLVTTTWTSPQLVFTVVIALAALISIIDPVYYGWLAKRRWLFMAYHALALFVVLLTVLPIIFYLSTAQSYAIATSLSMILAFPSLTRVITVVGVARAIGLIGLTMVLAASAWFGRIAVPPVTLWLTEGAITLEVDRENRSAGKEIRHVSVEELTEQGIFAYTAIRAPRGLQERIYHEWILDGEICDSIPLDISGGREAGYRAWTHKTSFPDDPRGKWRVRIITEAGQMIGEMRFRVSH